jgi:DNA polymerase III epsilon subunit-like protein
MESGQVCCSSLSASQLFQVISYHWSVCEVMCLFSVHSLAEEAHGLSEAFLSSQPSLDEVLPAFIKFVGMVIV